MIEDILLELKINPVSRELTLHNKCVHFGDRTETEILPHLIMKYVSTMGELKPRWTPLKTHRLLVGPEQFARPKTLQTT
jgi:hypothetical protein